MDQLGGPGFCTELIDSVITKLLADVDLCAGSDIKTDAPVSGSTAHARHV